MLLTRPILVRQIMLRRLQRLAGTAVVAIALAHGAFGGIWLSQLDAVCRDAQGEPLAGASLHFRDPSNGRHFQVKTDEEGKFFYIAVEPGSYDVQLTRAGKSLAEFHRVQIPWSSRPLSVDFNLARNSVTITRQVLGPESFAGSVDPEPAIREGTEEAAQNEKIQAINRELLAAKAKSDQGDWRGAIEILSAATDIDPNRDLPWAHLANAECHAAEQATTNRDKLLRDCIYAYGRAISLHPTGAYHNNLGQAYARVGRWEDAIREFRQAEQLDSDRMALYEMNSGKVLLQQWEARASESLGSAIAAFGQVIALEPKNAEAYYLKGVCLLREAAGTNDRAGYGEAAKTLRRYLQLEPGGRHAEEAQGMLTGLAGMTADSAAREE